METLGNKTFAFARECACSIYNCCDIRRSDREYNAVRDRYMAEKVQWFVEHGDGSVIFINGHNGHIGKVNSQTDDGFEELRVENQNALTALAGKTEQGYYYIDVEAAAADDGWNSILSDKQRMTSLNVSVVTAAKAFYTIKAVPKDMFDAMIVFGEVSPTTPDQSYSAQIS